MGSNRLSKSASVDLDRATTKAWRRFRRELADRIAYLGAGEDLQVAVEAAIDAPSFWWCAVPSVLQGRG